MTVGQSYGVSHHIYSENNILLGGIDEMIKAYKRDELGFQYVTANQNLRKVIAQQLRKGQKMNFVAEDSSRYFAEDQGASESMLSTQTENGYLHNILALQKEIDKDGSSKAASIFFPKEKWMEGTFHPRRYIDKHGNVVNESQLSTDTEFSTSVSFDSKNSDFFQDTPISISPSQSSRTSRKHVLSKTITGKKRQRGGNKTRRRK